MKRLALISALALFSLSCSKSDDVGTTAIPQDHVMSSRSCGTGCSFKTKQVSFPEVMKDGWIRVQVEREIHYTDRTNDYTTTVRPMNSGWLFADCVGARFGFSTQSDRSDTEGESVYYTGGIAKGTPKVHNPIGNVFQQWAALCPEEADKNEVPPKY